MMKVNYQKLLEEKIEQLKGTTTRPSLLLHCCCAPCSSYVLEYLAPHFDITAFFYNPNISPQEEYIFRLNELRRLIVEMGLEQKVKLIEAEYEAEKFEALAQGLETYKEGAERCFKCYNLRLSKTAEIAKTQNFDCFATTLTVSPYKNADRLNEIGQQLASEYTVNYLPSDFKKHNGHKRSIELSTQYNLYRQNYCGCRFSKRES